MGRGQIVRGLNAKLKSEGTEEPQPEDGWVRAVLWVEHFGCSVEHYLEAGRPIRGLLTSLRERC